MTILCSFGPSIPTLHPASPFNSLIWCFSFVLYFSTELVRKDWCIACTKDWPWRTHCTHFENLKSTYLIVDCHWLSFLIPLNILYHRAINTMKFFLSPTQCGKMASVLLRCAFLFDVCVVIWQTYVGCNAADCLNNQHLLPINSHWRRNFLGLRVAVWRLLSVVIIVETFIQICELRFVSLCIKYNWCDLIGLLLKYIHSWQHFSILNIHIDLLPLIYTKM